MELDQATKDAIAATVKAETAQIKATLEAQYAAKGHALRDWINAHPLVAARVIGTVCLIGGIGGTVGVQMLYALMRH